MKISITGLLGLVAVLFSMQVGLAGVPNGAVSFLFADTEVVPVYDLTGEYLMSQQMQGSGGQPVDLGISISMTNSPGGRLVGSGTGMVFIGDNDVVSGDYRVSGRISRSSGVTRAVFSVKVKGLDIVAGVLTPFNISVNYNLVVTPAGMAGTGSGKASFSKLGTAKIRSEVATGLPPGVDGRWALQMSVLPVVKLGGSGHIVLSNGRPLETKLSGTYSTSSDHSRVRLTGLDSSKGTSLLLSFTTEDSASEVGMDGTILGQSVRN